MRFGPWACLFTAVFLAGCTSYTLLSEEDRGALERELGQGEPAFLRVSMNETPFFRDATKKLLTPLPPDEVNLLEDTGGQVISPGPVERIIPAGTRVRLQKIEFPTAGVVASRILYTPRTQPWVYLDVDGQSKELPFIIVLPPKMKDRAAVLAALDVVVSKEDPTPKLNGYSLPVQDAIRKKEIMVDMPADALEASWGQPERKNITFDNGARLETWTYPGGKRKVFIRDGRVERFEGVAS